MSAADNGGAERPSHFRSLFGGLRRRAAETPAAADRPGPEAAPATAQASLRLLPAPGQAHAQRQVRPQQTSWFGATAQQRPGRIPAIEDFLARFRQVVGRAGIGRKDPLAVVLELLGEMLLHFTHLAEDHTANLDQQLERARTVIAEEVKTADRNIALAMTTIAAAEAQTRQRQGELLGQFHRSTEELLCSTVSRQTATRVWRDRIVIVVVVVASVVGAFYLGRASEHERMETAIQATATPLVAAALRDGAQAAALWLGLMQWNRLPSVERHCWTAPSGPGFRQACTFSLWSSPPLDTPPHPVEP